MEKRGRDVDEYHFVIDKPSSLRLIITRPVIDSIPAQPIIPIEISNHGVWFASTFKRRRRRAKRVTPKVPARKSLKLCTRLLADNAPISHFTIQIRFLREAPWSLHRTTSFMFHAMQIYVSERRSNLFRIQSSRELNAKNRLNMSRSKQEKVFF